MPKLTNNAMIVSLTTWPLQKLKAHVTQELMLIKHQHTPVTYYQSSVTYTVGTSPGVYHLNGLNMRI